MLCVIAARIVAWYAENTPYYTLDCHRVMDGLLENGMEMEWWLYCVLVLRQNESTNYTVCWKAWREYKYILLREWWANLLILSWWGFTF